MDKVGVILDAEVTTGQRIVQLKLGEQVIELTQYVAPSTGRPIPLPSHSNDQWRSPASSVANVRESNLRIL
jgi:hypothetical protein